MAVDFVGPDYKPNELIQLLENLQDQNIDYVEN